MVSDEILGNVLGEPKAPHPSVRIKELTERDRRRLLMHFLALDEPERQMRFGSALPDELLTRYVQKINFARDAVFGVYDDALRLVAVGHLAYTPRGAMPSLAGATVRERIAEFGVSVLAPYRGQGIGTRLFERAAMHCRNDDIDTLYVHCLSSNEPMMHIAIKAGMTIHRDHGETDAYLRLPPADPASHLQEVFDEQVASLDYTLKANTRALGKFIKTLPGIKND
ncbi:GNAT family N-acetyltransferase [Janthinobacterium sp. 17J80-10]|uniref:GNAT family N-acetyltransferase n=1 Tax=Janthinobacterium sp. 17J80-10 TaxID=2497863 RepID=UPI0010054474|nr:GNAT family N-acetyltransferase [Janthinobacterium sp. 17J80-10]QAU33302.1 GNAT family N-acetyltransferase [Janthinobacterium sp. 17J80-10]